MLIWPHASNGPDPRPRRRLCRLQRRAAEAGVSVPELLRVEATRLAPRPSVEEWMRRRSSWANREQVLAELDKHRGARPDARR
jgi:hypothetical protein